MYYAFLLAAYLVHRRAFSGIGVAPFVFYYRNFLGPDRASDIYVGQFWSLCVEEQFYLVWPLVLYFTAKRLRIPLILFLMCTAFLCRAYLLSRGVDGYVIYRLPFCHMDVLLAGALVAVLIRQGEGERRSAGLAGRQSARGDRNISCWSGGEPGYEMRLHTIRNDVVLRCSSVGWLASVPEVPDGG